MSEPNKCPVCGVRMKDTIFVCSTCWWKVPPKDRSQLRNMHLRGASTVTKLAKIVKQLKD